MIQFYSPDIESIGLLPESESTHCCRVLRLKEGDEIEVIDGKGKRFSCVITSANPRKTSVKILSVIEEDKNSLPLVTLAIAPTKNIDRIEWFIEKGVEIGIDKIIILKTARSERKSVREERLEKIMVSAMKQSLKSRLPELEISDNFNSFLENLPSESQKFIGYCGKEYPKRLLVKDYNPGAPVIIAIGPEGDFTPEEIEKASEKGFIPVSFGESRLRTETAALFALTAVNIINQQKNET